MMKVLIVEDEPRARERLARLLRKQPNVEVLGCLDSIAAAHTWFELNAAPDLVFLDIELGDGSSFELLESLKPDFPIIFTTAHAGHALEAYAYNSAAYLLKPYTEAQLQQALAKVRKTEQHYTGARMDSLLQRLEKQAAYKKRVVVRKGRDFVALETPQIAYLFTEQKIVFVRDTAGNNYICERTLSELQAELDPDQFYRTNRQFLINFSAIGRICSLEKGKLNLELLPKPNGQVVVSQENAAEFKQWLER
ncbi:MAG: LytR/AlgR family response regulator transcription factor [Sphingobacteriia bacterium]|jgi:two-component system LytT family response regulator